MTLSGSSHPLPRIAVTMGDPAGIGPELCLRLLADPSICRHGTPIVFGDAAVLRRVAEHCALPFDADVIPRSHWRHAARRIERPTVLDLNAISAGSVCPGEVHAQTGMASYRYVEAAIDAALAGEVQAVTTAPIHKEALHAAGIPYPGHTEMFIARTKPARACMMLTSEQITCSLVTAHVGLRDVAGLLTVKGVLDAIELTNAALERLRGRPPRLAVCGLNPHAGEHGLFGAGEEEEFIVPAIEAARRQGITATGPLPPDTAFLPHLRARTDGYICMYHDQGLIPLKALAFDLGVNVTLGLPIIRTSVDHGTALDIAWQNKADVSSLVQAFQLAARLQGQNVA